MKEIMKKKFAEGLQKKKYSTSQAARDKVSSETRKKLKNKKNVSLKDMFRAKLAAQLQHEQKHKK